MFCVEDCWGFRFKVIAFSRWWADIGIYLQPPTHLRQNYRENSLIAAENVVAGWLLQHWNGGKELLIHNDTIAADRRSCSYCDIPMTRIRHFNILTMINEIDWIIKMPQLRWLYLVLLLSWWESCLYRGNCRSFHSSCCENSICRLQLAIWKGWQSHQAWEGRQESKFNLIPIRFRKYLKLIERTFTLLLLLFFTHFTFATLSPPTPPPHPPDTTHLKHT